MGNAATPLPVVTGQYVPGTVSTDQLNLQGTGPNSFGGPINANAGVTGSKAWMYQWLEPTNTKAASVDGRMSATSTSAALTTGTVYECALPIESGLTLSNLSLVSIAAESGGTHAWVGLADNTNKVLTISADQTGAAYFPANTAVTTAIPSFTTTYSGLYYLFVCVVAATTMPTFASAPAFTHVAITTAAPIFCGSSLTGQTTPVAIGSSLGTITPLAGMQLYGYFS